MNLTTEQDRIAIAHALYDAGFPPSFSHNEAEIMIAGYGTLDHDFHYPLYLIDNKIQKWEDVRGWLIIEDKMEHARFAGSVDMLKAGIYDGDYVVFHGEFFRAKRVVYAQTLFEFISHGGSEILQCQDGETQLTEMGWNLAFNTPGELVIASNVSEY